MRVKTIAKLAVTLMLGASLAACVDGTVEVTVTGENSARATITQVMGADFYAMVKRSAEQGEAVTDDFCGEGELTEHEDGSATCIFTREGTLAEMSNLGDGENGPTLTAELFARLRPGVVILNTARGSHIDEAALRSAILSGRVAGAGLDVFQREPPDRDNPLFDLPQVVVSDHTAWYSEQSVRQIQQLAAAEAHRILTGKIPLNWVNPW